MTGVIPAADKDRTRDPVARRDGVSILAAGMIVAVAPAVWAPLIWSDVNVTIGGVAIVAVFSVFPFLLIAASRALGALRRFAAAVATLLVAAAVIYGQEYGLDPDNGSLSGLAIVYTPMYAVLLALLVFGVDRAAVWLFRREDKGV
jgi:hypothetical protein